MHQINHLNLEPKIGLKNYYFLIFHYYIVTLKLVYNTAAAGADKNNTNKNVIFKNYAPFTDCMREINNTQVDNAKYIDIVMPMYDLIEYSYNYSKT